MRRVVVTGMGVISPVGNNIEKFWNSLTNGVCGIDYITRFDTSIPSHSVNINTSSL